MNKQGCQGTGFWSSHVAWSLQVTCGPPCHKAFGVLLSECIQPTTVIKICSSSPDLCTTNQKFSSSQTNSMAFFSGRLLIYSFLRSLHSFSQLVKIFSFTSILSQWRMPAAVVLVFSIQIYCVLHFCIVVSYI